MNIFLSPICMSINKFGLKVRLQSILSFAWSSFQSCYSSTFLLYHSNLNWFRKMNPIFPILCYWSLAYPLFENSNRKQLNNPIINLLHFNYYYCLFLIGLTFNILFICYLIDHLIINCRFLIRIPNKQIKIRVCV